MKFFPIVYAICLHVYALAVLPKHLFNKKKRETLKKRLGLQFPHIDKQGRPLVWVHAVSVGETRAIMPFLHKLKNSDNPPLIIISNITETGHKEAKRLFPEARSHVFLPLDFSYIMRPLVRRIKPDCVILSETDFWFNFQDAAKEGGASLFLLNGKISERSFKRLQRLKSLTKNMLHSFDLLCVQDSVYAKRFEKLVPGSKIHVTGNMKLDVKREEARDLSHLRRALGIEEDALVLALGSTHDPEEEWILSQLFLVWESLPTLRVILAPRHPERCMLLAKRLNELSIPFSYWSRPEKRWRILLVDTIGDLCTCYQLSTLAFVGGSLCAHIGGHNIIEPLQYGVPVFFGDHMHSQSGMLELVQSYQAGVQVSRENFASQIQKYLIDKDVRNTLTINGIRLIEDSCGAVSRVWECFERYRFLHQKV